MKWYANTRPSPWDGLIAGAIVALAILCAVVVWGGEDHGELAAVVSIDGQTVEKLDLSSTQEDRRTYTGNGYTLHVTFCPGGEPGVQVTEADCPTQDCVHTGQISRAGQSIVCLPGRIVIELQGSGGDDGGVDAVLG